MASDARTSKAFGDQRLPIDLRPSNGRRAVFSSEMASTSEKLKKCILCAIMLERPFSRDARVFRQTRARRRSPYGPRRSEDSASRIKSPRFLAANARLSLP